MHYSHCYSEVITEIENITQLLGYQYSLSNKAIQGLDLRRLHLDWEKVNLQDTIFLGCTFANLEDECTVRRRGAYIFPQLDGLHHKGPYVELFCPCSINGFAVSRAQYDRDIGADPEQLPGKLNACHLRHRLVRNGEIKAKRVFLKQRKRL